MIEKIEKLLNDVNEITIKQKTIKETIAKETGNNFNIFEITHISQKEVPMCRILTELLDPNGSHGQNKIYLNLFFKIVLKKDIPLSELEVIREEVIEGCRRIDILIKDRTKDFVIPIEVKINACDQSKQLYDYSKKRKPNDENPKVYYLTKYGTEPSMGSRESLKDEEIGLISWNVDILNWIRACISDKATINKAPIREILLQFETAIEEFTLQTKKGELMEIENLLKTQNDIENAYSIAQAQKNTLLSRFKEKLEEELTKIKPFDDNSQDDNEWNLGYKLSLSEDKSQVDVARISLENNSVFKLIQVLNPNDLSWNNSFSKNKFKEKVFSISDDTIFELVKENSFNNKVKECVDWIIEQLKVNGQM